MWAGSALGAGWGVGDRLLHSPLESACSFHLGWTVPGLSAPAPSWRAYPRAGVQSCWGRWSRDICTLEACRWWQRQ